MECSNPFNAFAEHIIREVARKGTRSLCLVTWHMSSSLTHPITVLESVRRIIDTVDSFPGLTVSWRKPLTKTEISLLRNLHDRAMNTSNLMVGINATTISKYNSRNLVDWVVKTWSKRWKELSTCRQTKYWFSTPAEEKSKFFLNMDRISFGRTIQFLTGHGWYMRHRSVIDSTIDPTCRLCCEEEEEPFHVYLECPALERERRNFPPGQTFPDNWCCKALDWFLDLPQIKELEQDIS